MKNQALLLLLLGTLPALAQTPTPRISNVTYSGNAIQVSFDPQPNPFQSPGHDQLRTEVVLVTDLATSLHSAQALGARADHPILSTWTTSPDRATLELKPTYRARYFVAARFSARFQARGVFSPWSVYANADGPIALSASPDSLEETPEARATLLDGMGLGSFFEARFSLFARLSSNTEITLLTEGQPPFRILNPETVPSSGALVVASDLEDALSQASTTTRTVLLRLQRSGHPTQYRLFHHLPTLEAGDTVNFTLINPDGRILHQSPLFPGSPGAAFRMGRTVQELLCHPPAGQTALFTAFTPFRSPDSVAVGLLGLAMLRTHVPHASRFAEDLDRESIYATGYLQAFDSCLTAWSSPWSSLQALTPGLPRLRVLQNHLLTLAAGRIEEPYSDLDPLAAPVLAYDAYTRFVPAFPLLTKPQGAVALFLSVSPNVSLHRLERMGMAVSLPEWVSATQATGLLLPTDSSTLNPVLRQGLYLRGKVSGNGRKTTQYGIMQHLVRRPLGVVGGGDFHPEQKVPLPGGLVREGILQAGLGETGFQIWPESQKSGRWIHAAKNGHLLLGRQKRRLVVDRNQMLGDQVHLEAAGPDSAFLADVGTPQDGRQSGLAKATWQDVRALDTVGSDTGALWFRALDWSQEGAGDTVVHRVYEKRGSLLGFGLKGAEANGDVVVRAFGPQLLRRGRVLVEGHSVAITSSLQGGLFRNADICLSPEKVLDLEKVPRLFTAGQWTDLLQDGELHVLTSGAAKVKLSIQNIPYLSRTLSVRFELQDTALVRLDANRDGRFDANDDVPGKVELWSDMESFSRTLRLKKYWSEKPDKRREKDTWAVDMHGLQVKLRVPSICLDVRLENNAGSHFSFARFDSTVVQRRAYLFDSLKTREAMGGDWTPQLLAATGYAPMVELEHGDTYMLFNNSQPTSARFQIMYEYGGLKHVRQSREVQWNDVFKSIAFYSARNPVEGDRENSDWPDGANEYDWEDGKKLNEPPYGNAGTTFPMARLQARSRAFGIEFMNHEKSRRADSNIVYIHGFNVKESVDGTILGDKEVFKRLYHMGFKQAFASFHWFGDWTWSGKRTPQILGILPEAFFFNTDQKHAFQSSDAFYDLFYGTLKPGSVSAIMAHSLGNQVALDMLRLSVARGQANPPAQKYIMFEAAVVRETLHPYTLQGKDFHQSNDWMGLFRTSIRNDIDNINVYNKQDNTVLGLSFPTAQAMKKLFAKLTVLNTCFEDGDFLRRPEILAYCYEPFQPSIPYTRLAIGYGQVPGVEDLNLRQVNSNWPREVGQETDRKFIQEHSYYAFDPLYMTWDIYRSAFNVNFR